MATVPNGMLFDFVREVGRYQEYDRRFTLVGPMDNPSEPDSIYYFWDFCHRDVSMHQSPVKLKRSEMAKLSAEELVEYVRNRLRKGELELRDAVCSYIDKVPVAAGKVT